MQIKHLLFCKTQLGLLCSALAKERTLFILCKFIFYLWQMKCQDEKLFFPLAGLTHTINNIIAEKMSKN